MSSPQRPHPPADLERRCEAVRGLATAVRALVRAVVDTEVPDAVLAEATALARRASALLAVEVRPPAQLSPLEQVGPGRRLFSPVVGVGNPISPPMTVLVADGERLRIEAVCTLHRAYEGPPTFGHGGVSAMLLDQVLGQAVALAGRVALTRSLEVRYRRPVPVDRPLRLTAQVIEREQTRLAVQGEIAVQAEPGVVLVRAVGTFLVPTPEQATALFGHLDPRPAQFPMGD